MKFEYYVNLILASGFLSDFDRLAQQAHRIPHVRKSYELTDSGKHDPSIQYYGPNSSQNGVSFVQTS